MPEIVSNVGHLTGDHSSKARDRLEQVSDQLVQFLPRGHANNLHLTARFGEQPSADRREWTFPSKADSISCQYRELWVPTEPSGRSYRFESVLFHLMQYRTPGEPPDEIVAFHWHLGRVTAENREDFNNRPHLHLKGTPPPINNSHLGVTLGVSSDDQGSLEYLEKLLDDAARMLSTEVLDRLA